MVWIVIIGCYVIGLVGVIAAWQQFKKLIPSSHQFPISVIIAARNESASINKTIQALLNQDYPAEQVEIIVVDDHSEDDTASIVQSFNSKRVKLFTNTGIGKKQSITTGISKSKHSIIVTTDADCVMSPLWLKTIVSPFVNYKVQLVTGPVQLSNMKSFLAKLQSLELAALIGITRATIQWQHPVMCNGANLAFRRDAFIKVNGYAGNEHIPSGDDEFLMRKINTTFPNSVQFVNQRQALVFTEPQPDWQSFLHQRIRWASKYRFSVINSLLAFFVFGFHLAVLTIPFAIMYNFLSLEVGLTLLLTKLIAEFILLLTVNQKLNTRFHLAGFLVWQMLYPIYTIFIAVMANVSSYRWKDRQFQPFAKTSL